MSAEDRGKIKPLFYQRWLGQIEIDNEGSTARDYLARERNFLGWLKLSVTLVVIGTAFILHFNLGGYSSDGGVMLSRAEGKVLSILFYVLAFVCVVAGVSGHLKITSDLRAHKGFAQSGALAHLVFVAVVVAVATASILIIVRNQGSI
ncbi:uncharacterized protein L969DRAFT_103692 [Mixia osmundae IAM 14324]|uniref:DUF202 domain-containing protein n=1 Tax=Mixia osmundae (strain CBS 9802 / IAM 14324 / JCM 22182 / KY 12970) TaxID=764103 RepID=G7E1X4_MIXOS|nr:uncharacterized protein L969DRAFT_103692 [Mixia osmundae IAM 14324]KEI38656.1 hypothetical protein L969DRAFT_103692 [Mixia osmundae IAM 14324]GAA96887.1 hypothetical protein E5Q_03560 [Mixia osmundae IAM 14324]